MIRLRLCRTLAVDETEELTQFGAQVVDEDTEPAFVDPFLNQISSAAAGTHVLAHAASPRSRLGRGLLAYLHVQLHGHQAEVRGLTTTPAARSRGVATTIAEILRDDPSAVIAGGQAGYVSAWAYGNHPAAGRLSRRFGGQVRDRSHLLVRAAASAAGLSDTARGRWEFAPAPTGLSSAPVRDRPSVGIDGATVVAYGSGGDVVGSLRTTPSNRPTGTDVLAPLVDDIRVAAGEPRTDIVPALLAAIFAPTGQEGPGVVGVCVPAEDADLLRLCRHLGFHHRLTDVRYAWTSPPDSENRS